MPLTVTVQGAHSETVTLTYDTLANQQLAQQIANAINAGIGSTIFPTDDRFGPSGPIPGGEVGEFVQSSAGLSLVPTKYDYVVVPDIVSGTPVTGPAVLYGDGDPNEAVIDGSRILTFYASGAAAGSGTIIGGAGNNKITIPNSDAGGWQINLGGGNNQVIALGGGSDTITTGTGANAITLGNGSYDLFTSGTDTIMAGGGTETVFANGSNDLVYGNNSHLVFIGDVAGGTTVYGGSGSDTVNGGTGPDYFVGGSAGNNQLVAGSGAATLFGGGSGDYLQANGSGAQALYAESGNETLDGSHASGSDTFYGGSGNTYISGGGGSDTIVGGSGAATVDANAGASNVFDFVSPDGGGSMLVRDFSDVSQIKIHLAGVTVTNGGGDGVVGSGGLNITLSDGTSVTFQNITTKLSGGNFV